MKVLQINALYGHKSTGMIVKDIDEMLEIEGQKSYVACYGTNEDRSNLIVLSHPIGQKMHAILTRLVGKQGFWSKASSRWLLRKIREINPDVVHLHNLHSNYINLPILLNYCALHNKPVVLTLHDCWFFTGKCFHFQDVDCTKWTTLCGSCPKKNMDIPSILYDSSTAVFESKKKLFSQIKDLTVVGCSQWMADLAKRSPMFTDREVLAIYNGVDTNTFCYKKRAHNSKFCILTMANKWFLPENKTIREQLAEKLDNTYSIVVAGCTEAQLREPAEDDKVIKIGYTKDRFALADLYRSADVYLNLTFIDTLPTVNMESICCGTPVITYRSGGSPELIQENVTGYVVEQLDLNGILRGILAVKNGGIDRQMCSRLGIERFDKKTNYQQYYKLYSCIMKRRAETERT